jgi:hypothetical protein
MSACQNTIVIILNLKLKLVFYWKALKVLIPIGKKNLCIISLCDDAELLWLYQSSSSKKWNCLLISINSFNEYWCKLPNVGIWIKIKYSSIVIFFSRRFNSNEGFWLHLQCTLSLKLKTLNWLRNLLVLYKFI